MNEKQTGQSLPATEGQILNTQESEILHKSANQNMGVWLRNMQGATYGLGNEIRRLAEEAHRGRRPMNILEIGEGIPMKALEIGHPKFFRNRGDYLIYGEQIGKHSCPTITTDVVSSQDWTRRLLQCGPKVINDFHFTLSDNIAPSLNVGISSFRSERPVSALLDAYTLSVQQNKPRLCIGKQTDVLAELKQKNKKYDLVFIDSNPHTTIDITQLVTVQALLRKGGLAYLPITSWSPNSVDHSDGIKKIGLYTDEDLLKLENTLLQKHPDAFVIANFPEAKTLVIKGGPVVNYDSTI